jgi:hypothetical protein
VGTPDPLQRGERDNLHHSKDAISGNIFSISLSEENCWNFRRKKTSKP